MNIEEMREIVNEIEYKRGWFFNIHNDEHMQRPYLQITCTVGIDALTLAKCQWRSAKRYLSSWMCRQEIVGVVWGLIQDAEMHEAREFFRYKGASIYNPHLDPDKLVEFASKADNFNCRENSMTMEEI